MNLNLREHSGIQVVAGMITPTTSAQPMLFEFVPLIVASPIKAEEESPQSFSMGPTSYALVPVCNIVVPQLVEFVAVAPATPTRWVENDKMGAAVQPCFGYSTNSPPDTRATSPDHGATWASRPASPDHGAMWPSRPASPDNGAMWASRPASPDHGAMWASRSLSPDHGAMWASTGSAADSTTSDPDLSGCTTVAILNIPYSYPKWKLQAEIQAEGLAYDYFHFPQDSRRGRNRGFAFVNFVTAEVAQAFYRAFHNRLLCYPGSEEKRITVMPSSLQGFENNAQLHPSAATQTANTSKSLAWGHAARSRQTAVEDGSPARTPERVGRSRCFSRP